MVDMDFRHFAPIVLNRMKVTTLTEAAQTSPTYSFLSELTDEAMPRSRKWAQRKLVSALPVEPVAGTVIFGAEAETYLNEIRSTLIAASNTLRDDYCSTRWLWYLRRTDPRLVRGYLPNTEISVLRIAESITGASARTPDDDQPSSKFPLTFAISHAPAAKLARMLAMSEQINHVEGWLRRSSKGTRFIVQQSRLPDLELDEELERIITEFDKRALSAATERWHPHISKDFDLHPKEPLLAIATMHLDGIHQTTMWEGAMADHPTPFQAAGRFGFSALRLTNPSNPAVVEGSIAGMERPEEAAALVILSQAIMRHALLYSTSVGVNVPRVGYIVMTEQQLLHVVSETLALTSTAAWPLMVGYVPADPDSVLELVKGLDGSGLPSNYGPVLRQWQDGHVLIDMGSLTNALLHDLRLNPSVGGEWTNSTATDFELAVQRLIDDTDLKPVECIRRLRGVTLRLQGNSITDADAIFSIGKTLVLVDCKKYELGRPYDSGDYASVRNAQTKVEQDVAKWAERLKAVRENPVGDNFDFSEYAYFYGLVVTPEVIFTRSAATLQPHAVGDTGVDSAPYLAFAELQSLLERLMEQQEPRTAPHSTPSTPH